MRRSCGVLLRWVGRILIVLAVFVLVSSFFLPDAVQPLNSIACPEGTELDNARYAGRADNERLELVCTSPTYTESAAKSIALIVGGLVVVGLGSMYVSSRLLDPRTRVPGGPAVT